MFVKNDWLIQLLNSPKGYVNPFGVTDSNAQNHLKDVVDFVWMGAAEFEHGAVSECLADMWDNNLMMSSHKFPEGDGKTYYIIYQEKDNIDVINTNIINNYKKGQAGGQEVSKNDFGSFYNAMTGENKTKGWLCLGGRYAWFVDYDLAKNFFAYFKKGVA